MVLLSQMLLYMKPLNLLQLSNHENSIYPNSDRVLYNLSPTLYKTLQRTSFTQSNTARSSEHKVSFKTKSILEQRRAIRSILEQNSPQHSKKSSNFEVTGCQRTYKKFSVSPEKGKPNKYLLSHIPKSKTNKKKAEKHFQRIIIRSETLKSNRRLVPLIELITEKSEQESYEDSLRIEAKYFHN